MVLVNIYKLISNQLKERIQEIPEIHNVATSDDLQNIVVEVPKIREFGDFSTNAAMVLAKSLKKNPRQIAEILMTNIQSLSFVKDVSIAGPGFININVSDELWVELLSYILKKHIFSPDSFFLRSLTCLNFKLCAILFLTVNIFFVQSL